MDRLPLVRLISDYEESADPYFCKPWEKGDFTFFRVSRRAKSEIGRRELFAYLEAHGIECVPHGTVQALAERGFGRLVVYTDENEHGGKGKLLLTDEEAMREHAAFYASAFFEPAGECIRHFQLGVHGFEIPFLAADDWRSNCGTSRSWTRGATKTDLFGKIPTPYFAIDFIPGTMLATDFQFAPGTKNDGLETFLTPREMHDSVRESIKLLHERGVLEGERQKLWGAVSGDTPPMWQGLDHFWLRFAEPISTTKG